MPKVTQELGPLTWSPPARGSAHPSVLFLTGPDMLLHSTPSCVHQVLSERALNSQAPQPDPPEDSVPLLYAGLQMLHVPLVLFLAPVGFP